MSCSLVVAVIFGELPHHSLFRPLFRKLKSSFTEWVSLWKTEVPNPSFNDLVISSRHLLTILGGRSKTQLQKAFSLRVGALSL